MLIGDLQKFVNLGLDVCASVAGDVKQSTIQQSVETGVSIFVVGVAIFMVYRHRPKQHLKSVDW